MDLVVSLFLAAVLAVIPARIAESKGRSFGRWWFYGWMLFIVALPHSLLLRRQPATPVVDVRTAPLPPSAPEATDPRMGPCPSCGREVRLDTPACPFCRAPVAPG